jgi:hypothetical protein
MSAGLAAAAAGIGNKLLDAGAILKSPAVALVVAVLSDVVLLLLAVLASFCCAQSGRANKTPIATVAHHLRIVFLPEFDPKKPVYLMRLLLDAFRCAEQKTHGSTQR